MSAWTCPECRGSFPRPTMLDGKQACPWCGERVEHGIDIGDMIAAGPRGEAVTKVVSKDDDVEPSGLLEMFR